MFLRGRARARRVQGPPQRTRMRRLHRNEARHASPGTGRDTSPGRRTSFRHTPPRPHRGQRRVGTRTRVGHTGWRRSSPGTQGEAPSRTPQRMRTGRDHQVRSTSPGAGVGHNAGEKGEISSPSRTEAGCLVEDEYDGRPRRTEENITGGPRGGTPPRAPQKGTGWLHRNEDGIHHRGRDPKPGRRVSIMLPPSRTRAAGVPHRRRARGRGTSDGGVHHRGQRGGAPPRTTDQGDAIDEHHRGRGGTPPMNTAEDRGIGGQNGD